MQIHSMWNNYPTLQHDLKDVLLLIEKNIKLREKTVEKHIKDLIYSGGKLLRPTYLLLSSHIGPQYDRDLTISVAAALEVLHLATLVHDDIIDDAPTRRGQETIQSKYGKDYAVYTGDYLFCICFKILAVHSSKMKDVEFTSSMEKILLGELDQMDMRYNVDMTIRQYLRQISGKTAQLFALSCYAGATISEAPKPLKIIARKVGYNLGMAFQIMDDVLDYTQDSNHLGKPVLNDVKQGVYSLPLLIGLNEAHSEFKPFLEKKSNMTDEDLKSILMLIEKYQCVKKAHDLALKYTTKALKAIEKLPDGAYKNDMYTVTEMLLSRTL